MASTKTKSDPYPRDENGDKLGVLAAHRYRDENDKEYREFHLTPPGGKPSKHADEVAK